MKNKSVDKTTKKQKGGITGKGFKPGQSGNPSGRPKGSLGFSTLFKKAIRKIAKEKKLNIKDPETQLVVKAIIEGLKGNYSYYKDIMDRRYGKAKESLDITTGGKPLSLLSNLKLDDNNNSSKENSKIKKKD